MNGNKLAGERSKKWLLNMVERIDRGEIYDLVILFVDDSKPYYGQARTTPEGMSYDILLDMLDKEMKSAKLFKAVDV